MSMRTKLTTLRLIASGNARERRNASFMLRMLLRGIDLRGVTTSELGLDPTRSYWFSNSGGPDLDVVLRSLSLSPDDRALDIGCGKGGAMITMAKYSLARVDGVEVSPALVDTARRHLRRANVANSTVFCCDAAEFTDFDAYTLLYLYNPFPAVIMKRVMDNLTLSIRRQPRRMTLIYKNPTCHDLLAASGFRKTREFEHSPLPFYVYCF